MSALNKISMAIAGLFGTGNAATPLANRNLFIDGRMDNWIAGSGAATGGYGPLTMWYTYAGTGGAATISQVSLRGIYPFDSSPIVGAKFSQTTASTGSVSGFTSPQFAQHFEDVAACSGRSVTLSCKLWVDSGTLNIPGVSYSQNFGTGGSPTAQINQMTALNWNITTTPKKFSVRIDCAQLPSGFTMGTSGNNWTAFGLLLPVGVTFALNIAEMQVEYCSPRASSDNTGNGGMATAFEYRGYQAELARIQRYYQVLNSVQMAGYSTGAGAWTSPSVNALVQMRSTPAVSQSNQTYANVSSIVVNGVSAAVVQTYANTSASGGFWATCTLTLDGRI